MSKRFVTDSNQNVLDIVNALAELNNLDRDTLIHLALREYCSKQLPHYQDHIHKVFDSGL